MKNKEIQLELIELVIELNEKYQNIEPNSWNYFEFTTNGEDYMITFSGYNLYKSINDIGGDIDYVRNIISMTWYQYRKEVCNFRISGQLA